MKSFFRSLIVAAILPLNLLAQAPLPTSESFETFAGTFSTPGWTFFNAFGVSYQYTSGQVGKAGRIDATGEYIQVNTADQPGDITYYLSVNGGAGGVTFTGTFTVKASSTGATYSTIQTVTTLPTTAGTYQLFTIPQASIPAGTRYIRFFFDNKPSGQNIAIDEINIAAEVIPGPEINVKQGTSTILSGGTSLPVTAPVGTPTPSTFTVQNLGNANNLVLSSAAFSGTDAAMFSVTTTLPATVTPSSSIPFVITFNPTSSGTKSATLTINSNDADEAAYVINLYAVGGNLATEPTAQPTAMTFPVNKSYRVRASFTAATPAPDVYGGYLVIRKTGSAPSTLPSDGKEYGVGDTVGTDKVVYSGAGTSFWANSTVANTNYFFAVYAYNGKGTTRNYLTTTPLVNNITTPVRTITGAASLTAEYAGVSSTAATFVADLSNKTRTPVPFHQFYSAYDETMVALFSQRDTTNGQKVVTCVYSGEQKVFTPPFDWGTSGYSREHTFAHSWMPTNPADGSGAAPNNVERKEYNDQHHLFPTRQVGVNDLRCNYPFGKVVTVETSYLGCKLGLDAGGKRVFEPRDEQKGDVARALFFMCTRYNNTPDAFGVNKAWHLPLAGEIPNCLSTPIPYGQDQDILKTWHQADPPSSYEIARNDFLDSLQGNRNPFIDSTQWVCMINFENMTRITDAASITSCSTVLPMSYSNTTCSQPEITSVKNGDTRKEIMWVSINTTGITSPVTLTQLNFNTTGSTDANNDISKAELFYTGASAGFSTATPFGSAINNPDGTFVFSGSRTLSSGPNNFWLTYDIRSTAKNGNQVDAKLESVKVAGTTQTVGCTPAGERFINSTTGIESLMGIDSWLVSPNPASQSFGIDFSCNKAQNITVSLCDITGKKVLSRQEALTTGKQRTSFDISGISAGVYLVEVSNGSLTSRTKLIIE